MGLQDNNGSFGGFQEDHYVCLVIHILSFCLFYESQFFYEVFITMSGFFFYTLSDFFLFSIFLLLILFPFSSDLILVCVFLQNSHSSLHILLALNYSLRETMVIVEKPLGVESALAFAEGWIQICSKVRISRTRFSIG